jgi:hypothetical protein
MKKKIKIKMNNGGAGKHEFDNQTVSGQNIPDPQYIPDPKNTPDPKINEQNKK